MPAFFGKIHPKWKTPWISILIQAGISGLILVLTQLGIKSVIGAYQFLVSMSVILYFIPFLYMYAAVIKLAYRADRASAGAVLVPGGKFGVWLVGLLGFLITAGSMALAGVPPGEEPDKLKFVMLLIASTVGFIGFGLILYWRGARKKSGDRVIG